MGIAFMRWYNIAAKLYDLEFQKNQRPRIRIPIDHTSQHFYDSLVKTYKMNRLVATLELREYQNRMHLLIMIRNPDIKQEIKVNKIVFNVK